MALTMKKLPRKNKSDRITDGLHVAAQLIPLGVGSAVSEFIKNFFPNGFEKRKDEWLKHLSDKVEILPNEMQNKIIQYLETEEGKTLLLKTTITAISTHKIEKYKAMRDVLVGTIADDKLNYDQREIYVNILCELEIYDIILLKIISKYSEQLARIGSYEAFFNFVNKHGFCGDNDEFDLIIKKLKDKSLIKVSDHIVGSDVVYSAVFVTEGNNEKPFLIVTELTKQIISYLSK